MKTIASAVEASAEKNAPEAELKVTSSSCEDATLGNAIPEYLKLFAKAAEEPECNGFRVAIKISLAMSEVEQANQILALKEVVAERNWLVHKPLLDLDTQSPESEHSWNARLDEQHAKATVLCKELLEEWKTIQDLKSDAAEHSMAFMLASIVLSDRKKMKPDSEGWIPIDRFNTLFRTAKAKLETSQKTVIGIVSRQYLSLCEYIEFRSDPQRPKGPHFFRFS